MENSESKILIKGTVSDSEITYLQQIYSADQVSINRLETKGATIGSIEHGIQIIFQDFKAIDFVRDYFLVEIIGQIRKRILPLMGKAISYFKRKSKSVRKITIHLIIQCGSHQVRMQFVINVDQEDIFLQKLEALFTKEFLNIICTAESIHFVQENDSINVTIL